MNQCIKDARSLRMVKTIEAYGGNEEAYQLLINERKKEMWHAAANERDAS